MWTPCLLIFCCCSLWVSWLEVFLHLFFGAFMNQPFSAWVHTYPVVCAVVCLQGHLRFEKCRYMRKVTNKKKKKSAFQECVFKGFSQCLVPSPCGLFCYFQYMPLSVELPWIFTVLFWRLLLPWLLQPPSKIHDGSEYNLKWEHTFQ